MKRIVLAALLFFVIKANAQLLTWSPDFIQESSTPVTITMDANFGNKGLLNYTPTSDVYVHIGVITNYSTSTSDWKHAPFQWGTTNAAAQCSYLGNNKWKYTITGGLRTFFGLADVNEKILKIAILFRSGDGNKVQRNADGSDMFVPVYDNGLYARIDVPYQQPTFNPIPEPITKNVGDPLSITMKASKSSTLKILFNGTQVATGSGTNLSANTTISVGGPQTIIANANGTAADTMQFIVKPTVTVAPIPAGDTDGINYEAGNTSVVLVLYAPLKQYIYVEGDFTNWQVKQDYLMNKTPDGNRFWIRISGLTPGTEYAYQYLIDGTLKVADYNCEKILDPDNDQYISTTTYPNLKAYPTGKTTGIVSVLQTAKPAYTWQVNNFSKPNKQNLVIYELLVRDFTAAGNFQTLTDTLSYLQRLGVNAIEVMPFNEFEGNSSWGYNPDFYFAPDKTYGPENVVKKFIDECHKRGIAVIMDMVMNHSFGSSPMVKMYWDNTLGVPAANNPWFNQYPKHDFNVGYDFNHESAATQTFVHRVIDFWLKNYKVDGFRWDLAKGFTQKQTCNATGSNCDDAAFAAYDATRIAIWKKYYDYMQSASANSYCILEMFANDDEQKVESDYGMLLWQNGNYNYNQATMGYKNDGGNTDSWDLKYTMYQPHGFTQPGFVSYMESHDEERLMYKNEQYGASSGSYNVKTVSTGLSRNAMAAAFWAMQPGSKMLWEFGELGYDLSINRCTNGTVNNNCRLDPKPPHWDFYADANRKALYDVYKDLIHLKTYKDYTSTFTNGNVNYNLSDTIKWESVVGSNLSVVVFGNFGVNAKTATITFPSTGTWYSYLTTKTITVGTTSYPVTLQPDEYYVYTNKNIKDVVLAVNWLSFTAQKNGAHSVLLNWSTQSEGSNDHFEIERSNNGISFTKIGDVHALQSSGNQQYSFTDNVPLNGYNYYRIKQVDKDGSYQYSSVQRVSLSDVIKHWSLYPNPAKNSTALYALNNYNKAAISISDLNGRIIYREVMNNVTANQQISIPLSQLSKGIYVIKIATELGIDTQKLIVE